MTLSTIQVLEKAADLGLKLAIARAGQAHVSADGEVPFRLR